VGHVITFRVSGTPKRQPRPRAGVRKVFTPDGPRMVVRAYNPSDAEGWKSEIARAAEDVRPREPLEGPVRVELAFLFARPKRLCTKKHPTGRLRHDVRPDRDNLEKAALDVLQAIGFFRDDSQVCAGEVLKFYCAVGELPGAEIRIAPCEEIAGTNEELVMGLFGAAACGPQHDVR
jgi:Holliday junction resolvase RusA-like endonuclease